MHSALVHPIVQYERSPRALKPADVETLTRNLSYLRYFSFTPYRFYVVVKKNVFFSVEIFSK